MEGVGNNHAAILHEFGKSPIWEPYQLPELKEDEVTIKIEASTINPSDLLTQSGVVPGAKLPITTGKEGTGRIVRTGDKAKHLEGKRVTFFNLNGGGWAEYANVQSKLAFVIDDDVPVSSAASGSINPITALGMIDITKKSKESGFIHTAAASALGRMLNKLAIREKIDIIHIVRREEQAELLRSEGAQHVVVTAGDWTNTLADLISKLNIKLFFDALGGGEVQKKIIQLLPSGGQIYIYGILEGKSTEISLFELGKGLTLRGYFCSTWLFSLSEEERKEVLSDYSSKLKKELSSSTSKEFKTSQIAEAIAYYKENMTKGKVLLRP